MQDDFEGAREIYYISDYSYNNKIKKLQEIMLYTNNNALKKQIKERIEFDKKCLELFENNSAGYVYTVNLEIDEYHSCGYFAAAESAYEHGKKISKIYDTEFRIEKHQIIGLNGTKALSTKGYRNPYLHKTGCLDDNVIECEYYGYYIAVLNYDKNGELVDFYSDEYNYSIKHKLDLLFYPKRFDVND